MLGSGASKQTQIRVTLLQPISADLELANQNPHLDVVRASKFDAIALGASHECKFGTVILHAQMNMNRRTR